MDVAATFEAEAEAALAALPSVRSIVTSPLIRCTKLASYIARELRLPVKEDHRLMEIDFGTWERQAWSAIPRVVIDAWAADFLHARPHGGESVAMLRARVLESLFAYQSAERTLIVTHAGVIRAALATGEKAEDFNQQIGFGASVTMSSGKEERYE